MMLSPQAARMGTVYTTLRRIGMDRRFLSCGGISRRTVLSLRNDEIPLLLKLSDNSFYRQQKRFKASVSAAAADTDSDSDEDDLAYTHAGHAAAAKVRAKTTIDKPWMINLGRGNDNAWLMGPRNEEDWFTGLAPAHGCPGKFSEW
jgi:hypothetical protein